jgi:hypothetical protein
MSILIAKPIVKNKFWIVENSGRKVATIQAVDEGGGVAFVSGARREMFPSFNLLKRKYNIEISRLERKNLSTGLREIYGYPTDSKIFNAVYDLQKRIPVYTKSSKSKCFFCAGYYWIKMGDVWSEIFCPKLIAVNRYEHRGPFHTEQELQKNKP